MSLTIAKKAAAKGKALEPRRSCRAAKQGVLDPGLRLETQDGCVRPAHSLSKTRAGGGEGGTLLS